MNELLQIVGGVLTSAAIVAGALWWLVRRLVLPAFENAIRNALRKELEEIATLRREIDDGKRQIEHIRGRQVTLEDRVGEAEGLGLILERVENAILRAEEGQRETARAIADLAAQVGEVRGWQRGNLERGG